MANAGKDFDEDFQREQGLTAEASEDVQRFFSHANYSTRRQLIDDLRTRALVIEGEMQTSRFFEKLSSQP